jgi:hypothetical protein
MHSSRESNGFQWPRVQGGDPVLAALVQVRMNVTPDEAKGESTVYTHPWRPLREGYNFHENGAPRMKIRLLIVVIAMFSPTLAAAEDSAQYDLRTLLSDASYVFNRFEELSAGDDAQIDKYPVEIRKNTRDALSAVLRNVEREKSALTALLDQPKASSVDLLDVYTELEEVAAELGDESSNSLNWGDQKLGTDLAQLSAKTAVLAAKLGSTLRFQIAALELQLASCAPKKVSSRK